VTRRLEYAASGAAVVAVAVVFRWSLHFPTFRLFFGWPAGGTWPNLIEQAEGVVLGAGMVWLFRDRVGKHLAGWWHKHHGSHVRADLAAMELRLAERLDASHEDMRQHVTAAAAQGEQCPGSGAVIKGAGE
jgi:hypothetical protein